MMTLDEAKKKFDDLLSTSLVSQLENENEAEARFKLIDYILSDVLGWAKLGDFAVEKYSESGFADYVLSADGMERMVVEAKRVGHVLHSSQAKSTQYLAVKSAALKNAQDGLAQAQRYCVDLGLHFAVLTNGVEWIAYLAVRQRGQKPSEGKVIVFPTLEAISKDFSQFWDLFSRDAVREERYQICIREKEGLKIQSAEVLKPILKNSEIRYLTKSAFAADTDRIFKEFFSSMAGTDNPEMLAHCFVESKESQEADVNMEKITSTLLNSLKLMNSDKGTELQRKMQDALNSQRGEFVLIIGNKGAGKSTFVDRFFRLVLPEDLLVTCTVVRVDVGDSNGERDKIVAWLDSQILTKLEKALFENGKATNEQLQGIFFSEYSRWRDGPHKTLYTTNKDAFKIKFGEYVESLRNTNKHEYIQRLLKDIVDNRQKMPCLVFDNTDHFDEKFQETVFQYAQSLFRSSFNFIICPITDRTIWELSKHGPLQSYDTTSFYLPVPAMKSILEKRVGYLRKKLEDDKVAEKAQYFIGKGIRLSVQDISAFTTCLEEILIANEGVSRVIGSLSNFDIRRSLQLSQKIIVSPHVQIEELVKLYLTGGALPIKTRSVHMAIICGDSNHFQQEVNAHSVNLLHVQGNDITSPLLPVSLLRFFIDVDTQGGEEVLARHATLEDAINYFSAMGIPASTTRWNVLRLCNALLLSPYNTAELEHTESSLFRITPSGRLHSEWATSNVPYITEMALTTHMRSCVQRDDLLSYWSAGGKKNREDWEAIIDCFAQYVLNEDSTFVQVPNVISYASQRFLRQQFKQRWTRQNTLAPAVCEQQPTPNANAPVNN